MSGYAGIFWGSIGIGLVFYILTSVGLRAQHRAFGLGKLVGTLATLAIMLVVLLAFASIIILAGK